MKERPVIFNGEMVRAILDGRKTQTRRVMKVQPSDHFSPINMGLELDYSARWYTPSIEDKDGYLQPAKKQVFGVASEDEGYSCPFGQVGDRLWVREAYQGPLFNFDQMETYLEDTSKFERPEFCEYRADGGRTPEYYDADDNLRHGWKPSIHMPRWASRITLEINAVRVERLNSIGDVEAMREGIQNLTTCSHADFGIPGAVNAQHPVRAFQLLWESIYGVDGWEANPWVWVIEFKRAEAQEKAL